MTPSCTSAPPSPGQALRQLLVGAAVATAGAVAVLLPLSQSPVLPAPASAPAAVSSGSPSAPSSTPSRLAAARAAIAPAVAGDVRLLAAQPAAGLTCTASAAGTPLCVHGHDAAPPVDAGRRVAAGTAGSDAGSAGGQLGCYGDGTSGPRVRTVYAHAQAGPDRYSSLLPDFERWAAGVSGQVDDSARATGGRRHVRFATTGGAACRLAVLRVALPPAAFASFQATVDALQARGLTTPHSKYVVWADTDRFCGLATTFADDRPGPGNHNDGPTPGYARIDRPCWGQVEAHELIHMLGGVQGSAPHSTGGFHCNDGHDVMCYDDGAARSTQAAVCPTSRAGMLDCRGDDYFSTATAAGSYLDQHWNTATSSFLATTLTQTAPPAPSPSPSPSSTPSPTPSAGTEADGGGSEGNPLSLLPSLLSTAPQVRPGRPTQPVPSAVPALPTLTELVR